MEFVQDTTTEGVSMRLWSIHPGLLDGKGLIALWREGLLAKKVLEGKTKGYKFHPQLERFKNTKDPVNAINKYLYYVLKEAKQRGYNFNASKINCHNEIERIPVNEGQIQYEMKHLLNKLKFRNIDRYNDVRAVCDSFGPFTHPMFTPDMTKKEIELWEKL